MTGGSASPPAPAPGVTPPSPPPPFPHAPTLLNTSTKLSAKGELAKFAARTKQSPWSAPHVASGHFSRATVASRASLLIDNPDLVSQDSLNLCGPAILHRFWLKRDPLAYVQFLAQLFELGEGYLAPGSAHPIHITPSVDL